MHSVSVLFYPRLVIDGATPLPTGSGSTGMDSAMYTMYGCTDNNIGMYPLPISRRRADAGALQMQPSPGSL